MRLAVIIIFCLVFWPPGPAAGGQRLRLAAVGDVMMAQAQRLPAHPPETIFHAVSPLLAGCAVAFFNLEGALTNQTQTHKNTAGGRAYAFRTPPDWARHLAAAGFNLASLANNHAHDFGEDGLAETLAALADNGIAFAGPADLPPARMVVDGLKLSLLAFAPYPHSMNLLDLDKAVALAAAEAGRCDILIVSMHAGAEGEEATRTPRAMETFHGEERGEAVRFARAMVEAGADLVLGHGPHVPRAMEVWRGRLIAYSLGNFQTGRGIRASGNAGLAPLLIAELEADGRLAGGRVVSFTQCVADRRPALDQEARAAAFIHRLGRMDFPQTNALNPDGTLNPAPDRQTPWK